MSVHLTITVRLPDGTFARLPIARMNLDGPEVATFRSRGDAEAWAEDMGRGLGMYLGVETTPVARDRSSSRDTDSFQKYLKHTYIARTLDPASAEHARETAQARRYWQKLTETERATAKVYVRRSAIGY